MMKIIYGNFKIVSTGWIISRHGSRTCYKFCSSKFSHEKYEHDNNNIKITVEQTNY